MKNLKWAILGTMAAVTLATVTQPGFGDGKQYRCFEGWTITGKKPQCAELQEHKRKAENAGYVNGKKEVSAAQIFHDYLSNEVRAGNKYNGKAVMVTGRIAKVSSDLLGYPSIILDTKYDFSFVKLQMAGVHFLNPIASKENSLISAPEKAETLSTGSIVHAVCFGGTMVAGTPTLEDCVLQ